MSGVGLRGVALVLGRIPSANDLGGDDEGAATGAAGEGGADDSDVCAAKFDDRCVSSREELGTMLGGEEIGRRRIFSLLL